MRLPPVLFQPEAAEDVSATLADVATRPPVNGIVEIGGPERFRVDEVIRRVLALWHDPRKVVTDTNAGYYGIAVGERTLVPGDGASLGEIRLDDWLPQSVARTVAV